MRRIRPTASDDDWHSWETWSPCNTAGFRRSCRILRWHQIRRCNPRVLFQPLRCSPRFLRRDPSAIHPAILTNERERDPSEDSTHLAVFASIPNEVKRASRRVRSSIFALDRKTDNWKFPDSYRKTITPCGKIKKKKGWIDLKDRPWYSYPLVIHRSINHGKDPRCPFPAFSYGERRFWKRVLGGGDTEEKRRDVWIDRLTFDRSVVAQAFQIKRGGSSKVHLGRMTLLDRLAESGKSRMRFCCTRDAHRA